jgi:predicted nucleic acid-binding protein
VQLQVSTVHGDAQLLLNASALLAGVRLAVRVKRRRGSSPRVLADFLIGAHARHAGGRLLAHDRGYDRDYFRDLPLISP